MAQTCKDISGVPAMSKDQNLPFQIRLIECHTELRWRLMLQFMYRNSLTWCYIDNILRTVLSDLKGIGEGVFDEVSRCDRYNLS